jgi:hypothetical protein
MWQVWTWLLLSWETDAKECKGKFASARNSELIDSEVVFRGMCSCEDSEKSIVAEYFFSA